MIFYSAYQARFLDEDVLSASRLCPLEQFPSDIGERIQSEQACAEDENIISLRELSWEGLSIKGPSRRADRV